MNLSVNQAFGELILLASDFVLLLFIWMDVDHGICKRLQKASRGISVGHAGFDVA